jgi:hypothetical protein
MRVECSNKDGPALGIVTTSMTWMHTGSDSRHTILVNRSEEKEVGY